MWTKDEYFKALKKIGFEQQKGKKSDGSTRTFVHMDYPLVRVAIVDHKNTKELTRDDHTDLFNGICLVVLLSCLHNNKIDMACVESYCSVLDKSWQKAIKDKLVNLNLKDSAVIFSIMPTRLVTEMRKFIANLNTQTVLDYFCGVGKASNK